MVGVYDWDLPPAPGAETRRADRAEARLQLREAVIRGLETGPYYVAVIDGAKGEHGIHFPDLPGCVAMADTIEGVIRAGWGALHEWTAIMKADGRPLPRSRSMSEIGLLVEVREALDGGAMLVPIPFSCSTVQADGSAEGRVRGLEAKVKDLESTVEALMAGAEAMHKRSRCLEQELVQARDQAHLQVGQIIFCIDHPADSPRMYFFLSEAERGDYTRRAADVIRRIEQTGWNAPNVAFSSLIDAIVETLNLKLLSGSALRARVEPFLGSRETSWSYKEAVTTLAEAERKNGLTGEWSHELRRLSQIGPAKKENDDGH